MTPDDVITTRRSWTGWNWNDNLPAPTILATTDWLAYVCAMADAIEPGPTLAFPSEADVRWAWPDGVTIMLDHPIDITHTIDSHDEDDGGQRRWVRDAPHSEAQTIIAVGIGPTVAIPARGPNGEAIFGEDGAPFHFPARPVIYVGEDLTDVVSGRLVFENTWTARLDTVSASQRFLYALVVALGHRLTTVSTPTGLDRAARRRMERDLPDLRVLNLTSGASTESRGGSVEWSHRWMVRGTWRQQACGPNWSLRKLKWIDPYVKGPADKPLVIRPTIWKTT